MFKLKFDTDNDAFREDFHGEIVCIFERIADKIEEGTYDGVVIDNNGNGVGKWEFDPPVTNLRKQKITLEIIYDVNDAESPDSWDWTDLTGSFYDVDVEWSSDVEEYFPER